MKELKLSKALGGGKPSASLKNKKKEQQNKGRKANTTPPNVNDLKRGKRNKKGNEKAKNNKQTDLKKKQKERTKPEER